MNTYNSLKIKLEIPKSKSLDRDVRWVCPAFTPVDGIGEQLLWQFKGLVVAIGFIDDENNKIIGSGVMIAPGLCLTATHVIEETKRKHALINAFVNEKSMRVWTPNDFHAQKFSTSLLPFQQAEEKYSDVGVLSCSPFSSFNDQEDFRFAPIKVEIPKIGERLWATGYREKSNDGDPTIGFFISSGLVTEQYLEGRGSHLKGPCIEVAMKAMGGMSGGAVFNKDGQIVGVISTCLEGQDDNLGPTYVSLVWPSLLSTVYTPWPEHYWPDQEGGLQVVVDNGGAKVLGSARWSDKGAMLVKFYNQSQEKMVSTLQESGVDFDEEDYDLSDFIYDNFEEFLEEKGQEYLFSINKYTFDKVLSASPVNEVVKLFECVDTNCFDGIEDLDIQSISLLESGSVGVNATFNIRGLSMVLEISAIEHDYFEAQIKEIDSLHNKEIIDEVVRYEYYVRPYYRVNFTFNVKDNLFENLKFQMVTLKV